jgi:hypothetical protein
MIYYYITMQMLFFIFGIIMFWRGFNDLSRDKWICFIASAAMCLGSTSFGTSAEQIKINEKLEKIEQYLIEGE